MPILGLGKNYIHGVLRGKSKEEWDANFIGTGAAREISTILTFLEKGGYPPAFG
jgi:hypothetical protein